MRMPHLPLIAALTAAAAAVVPAFASPAGAQTAAPARPYGVARLGLEYGGEKVLQFEYSDGSKPEVTAGGGLLLTVGGVAPLATFGAHGIDAQLNAGLKWRTIPEATNQSANWLRFPVEGLVFYRTPVGLRLGAGAAVHLRNVLKISGEVADGRIAFKSTPGLLLQAEYGRGKVAGDLRYTVMEYELESGGTGTVGASSIGLGFSVLFGRGR